MSPESGKTLRELDQACSRVKGSAFRAFKACLDELQEGRDFLLLDADRDQICIEKMKAEGRVYPLSRNVVLLSAAAFEKLALILAGQSG